MKKGLFLILIILCFYACEPNVHVIPGVFHGIKDSIEFKVAPLEVKLGEEVNIAATHMEGDNKSVVVYSKSLDFSDTLITPFEIKKTMMEIGKHDIMFETLKIDSIGLETGDIEVNITVSSSTGTTIIVTE
jgi:hypothetical protein